MVSMEMPLRFQNLLAVAHRVERRGPRADGADAQPPHPARPRGRRRRTSRGPSRKILRIRSFGVQRGERVRNAVLRQVIAGRHLAAEAVAAVGDGHLAGRIGGRLNPAPARRAPAMRRVSAMARSSPKFGSVTMTPSISRGVLAEEIGAHVRFGARFDRAVAGFFGSHYHGFVAGLFERGDHLAAAALRQVAGEESAIADDDAERHAASFTSATIRSSGVGIRDINYAQGDQERAPPDGGVEIPQHYRLHGGRVDVFIQAGAQNQDCRRSATEGR